MDVLFLAPPPSDNLTSPERIPLFTTVAEATPNFNEKAGDKIFSADDYKHKFTTASSNAAQPRFKLDLDKVHNAAIKREKAEEVQKKKIEVVRMNRHIAGTITVNNKFIKRQALKIKSAIECM